MAKSVSPNAIPLVAVGNLIYFVAYKHGSNSSCIDKFTRFEALIFLEISTDFLLFPVGNWTLRRRLLLSSGLDLGLCHTSHYGQIDAHSARTLFRTDETECWYFEIFWRNGLEINDFKVRQRQAETTTYYARKRQEAKAVIELMKETAERIRAEEVRLTLYSDYYFGYLSIVNL